MQGESLNLEWTQCSSFEYKEESFSYTYTFQPGMENKIAKVQFWKGVKRVNKKISDWKLEKLAKNLRSAT